MDCNDSGQQLDKPGPFFKECILNMTLPVVDKSNRCQFLNTNQQLVGKSNYISSVIIVQNGKSGWFYTIWRKKDTHQLMHNCPFMHNCYSAGAYMHWHCIICTGIVALPFNILMFPFIILMFYLYGIKSKHLTQCSWPTTLPRCSTVGFFFWETDPFLAHTFENWTNKINLRIKFPPLQPRSNLL